MDELHVRSYDYRSSYTFRLHKIIEQIIQKTAILHDSTKLPYHVLSPEFSDPCSRKLLLDLV
jgi:hypothetical protein